MYSNPLVWIGFPYSNYKHYGIKSMMGSVGITPFLFTMPSSAGSFTILMPALL
jgi:hypothetical protein